jgi:hypothetical protein
MIEVLILITAALWLAPWVARKLLDHEACKPEE